MGEPQPWQDAQQAQEALTFRLFRPTAAAERGTSRHGLSPEMTLSAFFRDFYRPIVLVSKGAAASTVAEDETSFRYWKKFTGDPPICQIDQHTCAAFVSGLLSVRKRCGEPLSTTTINKHANAVQKVLDLIGPPGRERRLRQAQWLVDLVPFIERPPATKTGPKGVYTFDEIQRLVFAATDARVPDKLAVTPAEFWTALLVFLFNTGCRIGESMKLTWRMVDDDERLLRLPWSVRKGRKFHEVPLNDAAMAAIATMRRCHTERVFPWPVWPNSKQQLFKELRRLRIVLPSGRRFGTHGIRKGTGTLVDAKNPTAAQKLLGHSTAQMTRDFYVADTVVRAALVDLPRLVTRNVHQRKLFD